MKTNEPLLKKLVQGLNEHNLKIRAKENEEIRDLNIQEIIN